MRFLKWLCLYMILGRNIYNKCKNMKKILLIAMIMLLAFGSFAKGNLDNINTVNTIYTNIPVKIIYKQDSIFRVILDNDNKYVNYEIVNDTVLKITRKGVWFETNDESESPIVKIKTPKELSIKCSRNLKIYN